MTIIALDQTALEELIERKIVSALERFVDQQSDEFISRREVARMLRKSPATIKRWKDRGVIVPVIDSWREVYSRKDTFKLRKSIIERKLGG